MRDKVRSEDGVNLFRMGIDNFRGTTNKKDEASWPDFSRDSMLTGIPSPKKNYAV